MRRVVSEHAMALRDELDHLGRQMDEADEMFEAIRTANEERIGRDEDRMHQLHNEIRKETDSKCDCFAEHMHGTCKHDGGYNDRPGGAK